MGVYTNLSQTVHQFMNGKSPLNVAFVKPNLPKKAVCMATLCQLVARFMTFRLLFLTEIDMLAHFLIILAHIGLELILKLTLEFPPWECLTTCSEKFNMIIKALVCSVCGTLVYLGMEKSQAALKAEDNAIKNTFLPFTMHILMLACNGTATQ